MDVSVEKWVGLVEIRAAGGNEVLQAYEAGAFVNVVALAGDLGDFEKVVADACAVMGLELIHCNDVEPLERRLTEFQVDTHLLDAAKELSPANPVGFGTFVTFPEDDEDVPTGRVQG